MSDSLGVSWRCGGGHTPGPAGGVAPDGCLERLDVHKATLQRGCDIPPRQSTAEALKRIKVLSDLHRMTQPSAPPQLSPDGHWWWNGTEWVPADQRPAEPVPEQPALYTPPVPPTVPAQPQGYGSPQPALPTGVDGLAIASLVLSLVWLGGLGSVGAIVTGHMSRSKARREGRQPSGIALAGLILGYLGAAFITVAILAAIAIPVFLNQQQKGTAAEVKANLRNAAVAEEAFATDHGGYAPDTATLGFAPTQGVEVVVLRASATDYCLGARKLTQVFYYDSSNGGLTTTPCVQHA